MKPVPFIMSIITRIPDNDLLKIQGIISSEIERRSINDKNNSYEGV